MGEGFKAGTRRGTPMRLAPALALALALAGCASGPAGATLDATEGAKLRDAVLVRASVENEGASGLPVHFSQFTLRAGTAFFKCANTAWTWQLVDVAPERRAVDALTLAPGESVVVYLRFVSCSDVGGPYTLRWGALSDTVEVRPLILDVNATADLDAITLFARDWKEHERLVRSGGGGRSGAATPGRSHAPRPYKWRAYHAGYLRRSASRPWWPKAISSSSETSQSCW